MKLSNYLEKNKEKYGITEDFDFNVYDNIEINIDKNMDNYATHVRRPYYRLRGKPVSEEQAFEVIRRTDDIFKWDIDLMKRESDYVGSYHIRNFWFNRNHFPSDMGWMHRDGTLGGNGITDKYPEFEDLLFEMIELMQEFPYLDFVLAITNWDEIPDEMWENLYKKEYKQIHKFEMYEGFSEAIDIGFWIHDNTIDVLDPGRAAKKFKEYEEKYGVEDPAYYSAYYNMEKGIVPCDVEYLKRCIEAYGLDAEEILKNTPEYIWKE